jgi:hypothetical protein
MVFLSDSTSFFSSCSYFLRLSLYCLSSWIVEAIRCRTTSWACLFPRCPPATHRCSWMR